MPKKQHSRPLWLAALISPLVAPLCFMCVGLSIQSVGSAADRESDWQGLVFYFLALGLPVSYFGIVAFGVPYSLWLRSHERLNTVRVCLAAAVAGSLLLPVYVFLVSGVYQTAFNAFLLGAAAGSISGIAFCVAAGITSASSRRADARGLS